VRRKQTNQPPFSDLEKRMIRPV
jgi:hypothetical protein